MTTLAKTGTHVLDNLAASAGLRPEEYWNAMQRMCGCQGSTDAEFFALLVQSQRLGLDPMQRQLYLMRTQRGVQVVVPIDGYLALMLKHEDYLSHEIVEERDERGNVVACTAIIHRKAQHKAGLPPFRHTEYMAECRGNSGPWKSHPVRMLKHKAMSQAVRYAFNVYVPDANEWERAADVEESETKHVEAEVRDAAPVQMLSTGGEKILDRVDAATNVDQLVQLSEYVEEKRDKLSEFDVETLTSRIAERESEFLPADGGDVAAPEPEESREGLFDE